MGIGPYGGGSVVCLWGVRCLPVGWGGATGVGPYGGEAPIARQLHVGFGARFPYQKFRGSKLQSLTSVY